MAEPTIEEPTDPPAPEPTAIDTPPPASDPEPKPDPADWMSNAPENWREVLAGEDEARLNQLKRVTSIQQLAENYFNAQETIRQGKAKAETVPDEDSTDEEWAAYRAEKGIPETPEAYQLSLDEGLVLGPEDERVLSEVYPVAHELGVPTETVSKLANAMLKAQATQLHSMQVQQDEYRKEATSVLKDTWGPDYQSNITAVRSTLIDALPEAVRENFEHAVMADGRKLFNSPEVLVAMADWARAINPAASVVPNNANPMATIDSEIAALEEKMGTPEWYNDQASQKRYQELVDAKTRLT